MNSEFEKQLLIEIDEVNNAISLWEFEFRIPRSIQMGYEIEPPVTAGEISEYRSNNERCADIMEIIYNLCEYSRHLESIYELLQTTKKLTDDYK